MKKHNQLLTTHRLKLWNGGGSNQLTGAVGSQLPSADTLQHWCGVWNRERPRLDAVEVLLVEMNNLVQSSFKLIHLGCFINVEQLWHR